MDKLKISHLTGRELPTLSGGEAQATLIASRVVAQPSVILFDEVISALDPAAARRVQNIIRDLSRDGITGVLADSDTQWLQTTAERSLLLHEGKLLFDGSPQELGKSDAMREFTGAGREQSIFRERHFDSAIAAVEHVTFGYGDSNEPVLDDVSFTIPDGSCTVIIGHNGSGKSTVGKLLSGYQGMSLKRGTVRVNGKDVAKLSAPEALAEVAYMFQRPSEMFMTPTVSEDFLLSCRILEREPAVALRDFGLAGLEEVSPHQIAVGQQQRLMTAAMFAVNPNLLILDEPTRGQSRNDREQLRVQVDRRSDAGKATVLITHDMQLARSAADKVVVMDHGRVIREDRASEVFADHELFDRLGFPMP